MRGGVKSECNTIQRTIQQVALQSTPMEPVHHRSQRLKRGTVAPRVPPSGQHDRVNGQWTVNRLCKPLSRLDETHGIDIIHLAVGPCAVGLQRRQNQRLGIRLQWQMQLLGDNRVERGPESSAIATDHNFPKQDAVAPHVAGACVLAVRGRCMKGVVRYNVDFEWK